MSTSPLERVHQQVAGTGSQAAMVEHTRAAAEVAAAVQAARMVPRDLRVAYDRMRAACGQYGLGSRAFYAYSKGGETVQGPTVVLARELAAIYGNVDYGTAELARRDDESELRSWAWDQESNTRRSRTSVVPHQQYTGKGRRQLLELRDVDQNNNSVAGRAEREVLLSILPASFVEEAKRLCREALERGDGTSVEARAARAVESFGKGNVSREQLEARVGRPVPRWTAQDVADLEVLFESLRRREISREEAFPGQRVTAADITRQAAPAPAADPLDVVADEAGEDFDASVESGFGLVSPDVVVGRPGTPS